MARASEALPRERINFHRFQKCKLDNQSPQIRSRADSRNVVYIKYTSENGQCSTQCFYYYPCLRLGGTMKATKELTHNNWRCCRDSNLVLPEYKLGELPLWLTWSERAYVMMYLKADVKFPL
jgi:hypothetical protein